MVSINGTQKSGGGSRASKKRARAKAKKKLEKIPDSIDKHQGKQEHEHEKAKNGNKRLKKEKSESKKKNSDVLSTDDLDIIMVSQPEQDINISKINEDSKDENKVIQKSAKKKKVGFAENTNFDAKPEPEYAFIQNIINEYTSAGANPPTPLEILYTAVAESDVNGNDDTLDCKIPSDEDAQAQEENDDDDEEVEDIAKSGPTPISSLTTQERAKLLMASLLHPTVTLDKFYSDYWEKKPLYVPASKDMSDKNAGKNKQNVKSHRLEGFLTKKGIRKLLQSQSLRYGKDLNVTNYIRTSNKKEKRRITLDQMKTNNPESEDDYIVADAKDVWANFESSDRGGGCSIRLLCPQKYVDNIHAMLSLLEQEFGCMVGSNVYLTPPNSSQGFAPHYDDIDAYILQLEGKKHWKVYEPFSRVDSLPRMSSRDFTVAEMKNRKPVLDIVLNPGDVLYMPRGWVHQACTLNDEKDHSLHLTVSAMQNWSWIDLMENIIPQALDNSAMDSLSLRQGLPNNFLSYMGIMHQEENANNSNGNVKNTNDENDNEEEENEDLITNPKMSKEDLFLETEEQKEKRRLRQLFKEEAKKRIMRVCKEAISMIDSGCDEIGKRFLSDRLPPSLTRSELLLTSEAEPEQKQDEHPLARKILPTTLCRLIRPNIARLVIEPRVEEEGGEDAEGDEQEPEQKAVLYHCAENTREFHGNPMSPMEFELDDAAAIEILLTTSEPQWVRVSDLTHDGEMDDKISIVQAIYDEGILAIWNPEVGGALG